VSPSQFPIHLYFDEINAYIQGFIVPFLVIITLPRFIHQLFAIPSAKRHNVVFFVMAMFTYSIGQFLNLPSRRETAPSSSWDHERGRILVFLYSLIWGLPLSPDHSGETS